MPDHILIDDLTPRVNYVVGASPQTVFAAPFPFFEDSDLTVYVDGVVQTLDTDYTVTGEGVSAGGTVTFVASIVNADVAIVRTVPYERTTDFPPSGPLATDALNTDLDRIVAMIQQLAEGLERTVRLPEDEETSDQRLPSLEDRAGNFAAWDDDGQFVAISGVLPDDVVVSSFVEPALAAADIGDFFDALGVIWLTANRTVYVRADATGDTGRDGSADTTASAFQTWQAAINWVIANLHCNGFIPIITQGTSGVSFPHEYQVAGPVISIDRRPPGGREWQFVFGATNDDDVRLECTSGTSNATLSVSGDFGLVRFSNKVRLRSSGFHFKNNGHGKVFMSGIWRHQNVGANHYIQNQQEGSYFSQDGELKWEADCEAPIRNDSGTYHGNGNITVVGSRTFTTGAYRGDFFSQAYLQGVSFSGSYTGPRFNLKDRAVLRYLSSQPPPGSTRGTAQPGCVVSWDGVTENVRVGSATFAASDTVAVTFNGTTVPHQFDTNYIVFAGAGGTLGRDYKVTSKLTTGFTITASVSNSDTIGWRLEWLP